MPFESVVCVSDAVPLLMNVPSAVDGAVKVTEAPLNGEPFELTKTENVPNGFPTGCGVMYPPDCAAIAMLAGGGVEELPQPTKKAVVVKARIEAIAMAILEWIFRFKATLLSVQPSRWLDHGIAAKSGCRTCFGYVCVAARLDSAPSTATFPARTDAAEYR
jgi:hypothetical protein